MRTEPISLVLCLITPLLGPMAWSQAIDLDKELRLDAAIGDDGPSGKSWTLVPIGLWPFNTLKIVN